MRSRPKPTKRFFYSFRASSFSHCEKGSLSVLNYRYRPAGFSDGRSLPEHPKQPGTVAKLVVVCLCRNSGTTGTSVFRRVPLFRMTMNDTIMTRTPNYDRQIEAAMETMLVRLVGSPQSIKVLEHHLLGPKHLNLSQGHHAGHVVGASSNPRPKF